MDSMTVTRDTSNPRILIVADGDASERAMWIRGEMAGFAGKGLATAWIRSGARIDDPADTRSEAAIRADPAFVAIYVEVE